MNISIKNKFLKISVFGALFILFSGAAFSQSCESYPFQDRSNTIEFNENGKFKLLATSAVPVDFDDPSEVSSARREAELKAKRAIAEYINQNLSSEDSINTEINKSKTHEKASNGSVVSNVQRNEVKQQLIGISSEANAVLKGVMTIGSCYTKGHEVRVTVGIKSETIEHAEALGKSMGVDKSKSYGANASKQTANDSPNAPVQSGTRAYDGGANIQKF